MKNEIIKLYKNNYKDFLSENKDCFEYLARLERRRTKKGMRLDFQLYTNFVESFNKYIISLLKEK